MDANMTLKEKLTELIRDRLIYASGIQAGDLFQHTAELTVENIFAILAQEGYGQVESEAEEGNPYILHGEELERTAKARMEKK